MTAQFQSYKWQPSYSEQDVDFVIAWNGQELIGRSAVVTREVLLDGKALVIMGLAGVTVKDDFRSQGLSAKMLELSMNQVKNNEPDFCILLCEKSLEPMYKKLGFRAIPGKNAVFAQPDGSYHEYKPDRGITMVYEKNGKTWPGGLLDLNGLPF
jgi:predicted N-acetyltransferase YhbS